MKWLIDWLEPRYSERIKPIVWSIKNKPEEWVFDDHNKILKNINHGMIISIGFDYLTIKKPIEMKLDLFEHIVLNYYVNKLRERWDANTKREDDDLIRHSVGATETHSKDKK